MDLRQGRITIGELAKHPKAVELLNQFDPRLIHHPMAFMVKKWTVNQSVDFARKKGVSEERIRKILRQLEEL